MPLLDQYVHAQCTYSKCMGTYSCFSSGNEYILVGYHFDANAILAEPIKNRQARTLTSGWKILNKKVAKAGLQPNTYILDNEVLTLLISAMETENITYQLVPPHIHKSNLAEIAIKTFKNHFKADLATLDPDFSLAEIESCLFSSRLP